MSDPKHALQETATLVEQLLNGSLPARDATRLEQLVIDDEACRRYYVRALRLHAALPRALESNADQSETADEVIADSEIASPRRLARWGRMAQNLIFRPTPLSLLVAGVFTTALILTLAVLTLPLHRINLPSEAARPQIIATLMRTQDAQWSRSTNLPNDTRPKLYAQQSLELMEGFAQITFRNGTDVLLQAPCKVMLQSEGGLVLQRGKITAIVPRRAIGFTIETALASFVDLGTEFGVEVEPMSGVSSHVFEGRVQVNFAAGKSHSPSIDLWAGETLHIEPNGQLLSANSAPKQQFVRRMGPTPKEDMRHLAVARWRFDNRQGAALNTAGDSGRVGRVGGELTSTDGPPNFVAGANFRNGYVAVDDEPALRITGPLSIECWVRSAKKTPETWERIVEKNFSKGYVLCLAPSQAGTFGLTPGHAVLGINNVFAESIEPINDGQWHHVVGVWNGRQLRLYVDGRSGQPVTAAGPVGVSDEPLAIGVGSRDLKSEKFQGDLAEVALYAQALPPGSVRAHHDVGRHSPEELSTGKPAQTKNVQGGH